MAFLWDELERRPKAVQEVFFDEILAKEPIRSFSEIKKGDHIIYKSSSLSRLSSSDKYHHCLCIDHDDRGSPTVIHYYGTSSKASSAASRTSSKACGVVAKVQRMQLPNEEYVKDEADLEKMDAQRVIWSPDVRRYSVEETIKRVLSREGESRYDLVKSYCEHFVMWCLCGINTSLQVKDIHLKVRDVACAVKDSGGHVAKTQAFKGVAEAIMNSVDDTLLAAGKIAVKGIPSGAMIGLNAACGIVAETVFAIYEIHSKYKLYKLENGPDKLSKQEFHASVYKTLTSCGLRAAFGLGGAVVGQMLIPVPILGAIIGNLIGAWFGNSIPSLFASSKTAFCGVAEKVEKGYHWMKEKVRDLFRWLKCMFAG